MGSPKKQLHPSLFTQGTADGAEGLPLDLSCKHGAKQELKGPQELLLKDILPTVHAVCSLSGARHWHKGGLSKEAWQGGAFTVSFA